MPLTINLKPHEKLILNGVVIENSGPMAKILIHTTAALLREKDVLPEEQATTPARRIYFAIQCRYLFAGKADRLPVSIDRLLADYAAARPEERPTADPARGRRRRRAAVGSRSRPEPAARRLRPSPRRLPPGGTRNSRYFKPLRRLPGGPAIHILRAALVVPRGFVRAW